ncbi:hypothetical protein DUU09_11005 [Salmonella enterica subsp. enterica serovar Havana]|nr:hypothetical protein [Salmonella enterica subsp. enterica serovar Havana]EBY1125795.1 hypothetical protein [Salmonella enterica subsp. enterica serovar Havana]ECF1952244.1 hypothetical protein [Salmonella enterica subsp. enterica serovar Havana]
MNGYQPLRILPGSLNKAKHLNTQQRQFRQFELFFKNRINHVQKWLLISHYTMVVIHIFFNVTLQEG